MKEIGLQLYTVRNFLADETRIDETMNYIKKCGYSFVQVYGDAYTSKGLGLSAIKAGLKVISTTGDFDEFYKNPKACMDLHRELGTKHIGICGYWYKNECDVKEFINKANEFARTVSKEGFLVSYHNHSHEFIKYNDKTVFDMLYDGFIPEISFVLDTYWLQHGGADIRYWIEKLNTRIEVLHLKDMKRTEKGVTYTEIGNGNLWWDGIIKTAENCNVKYFVVEQDECEINPLDSIKISREYLYKNFISK